MTGTATAQEKKNSLSILFSRFSPQFWLVNTFEFFERGAFYTMMAIFAYHFIYNVKISDSVIGMAMGVMMLLLYFVPILASVLAAKIGYRNIFIMAFGLIILGYIDFSLSNNVFSLLLGIAALGFGAGCFKPMVSSTIAHVTKEIDRDTGYSIYYWMINLGSFVFPTIVGYYFETYLHNPGLYAQAFLIAAALVVVNVFTCFIFFKEPVKGDKNKTLGETATGLKVIFEDKKFVLLLMIYSGFWFVYSLNLTFLSIYIVDFGLKPNWFPIMWIGVVNPLTIIISGPFVSKLIDKYSKSISSVQLMITGIILYGLGMIILAFWKVWIAWIVGIIVFSFGEFITHPSFISYVSKLAPKDKVAIYMGYAFIPIGIGNSIGAIASGFLYSEFSVKLHKPTIFWAIIASVAFLTVAGLLVYNRYWSMKEAAQAELVPEKPGVKALKPDVKFSADRIWNHKATPIIALIVIPILLFSASGAPAQKFLRGEPVLVSEHVYNAVLGSAGPQTGTSTANSDKEVTINVTDINIFNLTVSLSWTDEPPPYPGTTNQPDEFSIKVVAPDGQEAQEGPVANQAGSEGRVSVTFHWDPTNITGDVATGDYKVKVHMGNAGPSTLKRGLKIITFTDAGNDWTLEVVYKYLQEEKKAK
jgi:proton-dependent oligopeptide transporter, POT family